jgi:hypothetical protein
MLTPLYLAIFVLHDLSSRDQLTKNLFFCNFPYRVLFHEIQQISNIDPPYC